MIITGRNTAAQTPMAQAAIVLACVISLAGIFFSPEPLTVVSSGLCLVIIVGLLWRYDEPPILLLPALFQWSEVAIWPLCTIWKQVGLNELSPLDVDLNAAAIYGLAGVAMLALGLRLGSRSNGLRAAFQTRLYKEAQQWRYRDVTISAFTSIAAGYLTAFVANFSGPARELLNQVSNLRYVGLFAFCYWCLSRRKHMFTLIGLIAVEVVFGMTGFFAEFKNSLLTFLMAALATRSRFRVMDVLAVSSAGLLLLIVAIFWSEIKPSYRNFVNHGTGEQVVLEPLDRRLGFLANAMFAMDENQFSDGFDRLVSRHGYIEFLAATMKQVPAGTPHESGGLTFAVLKHMSTPRFLFPDKPPLPNDTEITARYTNLPLAINDKTSISIGYLGELYVDFGLVGGLTATGLIGYLVGFAYRTLQDQSGNRI